MLFKKSYFPDFKEQYLNFSIFIIIDKKEFFFLQPILLYLKN
jgi:hypothetical protein